MNRGIYSPLNFRISYGRVFFRFIFFVISIGIILYSLFGSGDSSSLRTLWIVDTSLSMAVQDVEGPDQILLSRLDAAKMLMLSGILDSSGENGLITFDDNARLQLPFSRDEETFFAVVGGLTPKNYGGATDIANALSTRTLVYPYETFRVILITDGENSDSGMVFPTFPASTELIVVGIGTSEGGPMLQGYDADGKPRYKQYAGSNAISRLDETYLRDLVRENHGEYLHVDASSDIDSVVARIRDESSQILIGSSGWTLSLGVILLLITLMMKPYRALNKI